MKVALLIPHGKIGGIELHALSLAQGLTERGDTPVVVMQFSGGPLLKLLDQYNIRYFVVGGKNGHDPRVAFRLNAFLRKERPDILHIHSVSFAVALTLRFLPNLKVVTTEHMSKLGRKVPLKTKILWRLLYFRSSKVICVSNSTKAAVIAVFPKLNTRTVTVYNGIPVEAAGSLVELTVAPAIKKKGESVVGAVGRLAEGKGWMEFLQIAQALIATHPNVTFQIIGDGPIREDLFLYAQQLAVTDSVAFLGYHSNPRKFIRHFDIFLLLSEHEACPLTLIEAFAEKTPVAGFLPLGGVSEVNDNISPLIEERDTSLVVDVISELLIQENKRKEQAGRAYNHFLENYTSDIMSAEIGDIYKCVLAR